MVEQMFLLPQAKRSVVMERVVEWVAEQLKTWDLGKNFAINALSV